MAPAAEGVGGVMGVIDAAGASGQKGERTLGIGSRIFIGDLVATDAAGEAQLLFSDGTRMIVGNNSSLKIEDVLFTGNVTGNRFAVEALAGTFRFISGDSGDQGFSMRTPSATIGVRGTAFDFTVTPSGETKMLLLEGEATLCNEDGEDGDCATVATPCALLHTESGEEVEEVTDESERVQQTREHFPYQTSQSDLREEFQVAGNGCAGGGLANQVLAGSDIPTEAIVIGAILVVGGIVVGLATSNDSNNNTND
jgi:ferric-dicitrate binding protein FerR (iron transport regulator)